ncbi:MAG: ERF family protein, partial [Thaumarchaeota archaeon]|nr:ERF family protein [Nitrososphaerota archaeon]
MEKGTCNTTIMETSSTIKELAGALVKFQKEVGAVKKDATNPFYHSTYATLQSVIDTIREPMAKNGLSFAQVPDGDGLCTILMHTSGE